MRNHENVFKVTAGEVPIREGCVYISVDVETSGSSRRRHSMLSLGACVVGNTKLQFYSVLRPISDGYNQGAMMVLKPTGLTMAFAREHGLSPLLAMFEFERWILHVSQNRKYQPVFAAHPLGFDWPRVDDYFDTFLDRNPFGRTGLDMKTYFAGLTGCNWLHTGKDELAKRFPPHTQHTHHALDDAIEQAEILEQMLRAPR